MANGVNATIQQSEQSHSHSSPTLSQIRDAHRAHGSTDNASAVTRSFASARASDGVY